MKINLKFILINYLSYLEPNAGKLFSSRYTLFNKLKQNLVCIYKHQEHNSCGVLAMILITIQCGLLLT